MTREHGVFGYVVVFDVNSADSFKQASKTVASIFSRFKFSRVSKQQPPVSVVLVGNKIDLGQRAVTFEHVAEVMAEYIAEPFPTRAAVQVSALPRGAQIEADAILVPQR